MLNVLTRVAAAIRNKPASPPTGIPSNSPPQSVLLVPATMRAVPMITTRDLFAAHALCGLIQNVPDGIVLDPRRQAQLVTDARSLADQMVEALD